jgi:hypothetical protein
MSLDGSDRSLNDQSANARDAIITVIAERIMESSSLKDSLTTQSAQSPLRVSPPSPNA